MNKVVQAAVDFFATKKAWLGDDATPVEREVAQRRADTCLTGNEGKPCPHNRQMPLFEVLTHAVAMNVVRQLRVKDHLGLKLQREAELHTCDVCLCSNRLKPWTPSKFIHVSFGQSEIPKWCWMHELFDKPKTQNSHDTKIDGLPE